MGVKVVGLLVLLFGLAMIFLFGRPRRSPAPVAPPPLGPPPPGAPPTVV